MIHFKLIPRRDDQADLVAIFHQQYITQPVFPPAPKHEWTPGKRANPLRGLRSGRMEPRLGAYSFKHPSKIFHRNSCHRVGLKHGVSTRLICRDGPVLKTVTSVPLRYFLAPSAFRNPERRHRNGSAVRKSVRMDSAER